MTTEEFIHKAKQVHGDKYNYSKVEYIDSKTKVCIICKEHGEFWQSPCIHLQRKGCTKCGRERTAKFHSKSLEQFLQEAKKVHGNKYDYSKVDFANYQTKVVIICPKHGEYTQSPTFHLQGHGCPKCGNERTSLRMNNDSFIEKAKSIHGDRYDYSKVEYVDNKTEVCIICREHGEFWQKPKNHLSGYGCPICSGRKKMRTIDFIKRAKQVHGDKYDYSKAEYKGNSEEVCIICPDHGEFWQRASNHLKGFGCKQCGFIATSAKQKIWTQEKCYETARQYENLSDFIKRDQVAFSIASRNKWLNDYTWLKRKQLPNGYWTKELVLEEARKYTSSHEFEKGNPKAYSAAKRKNWIKECTWFIKPKNAKKWNYDTCYEEAIKYKTKSEFRKKSITAYCNDSKNNWVQEDIWLDASKIEWNYKTCFEEAQKYKKILDFRYKSFAAYKKARDNGWLKTYSWLIKEPTDPSRVKWNYDTCYTEAKKYKTISAFQKNAGRAYVVSSQNGWIDDFKWFEEQRKPNGYWGSYEHCYEEAQKYKSRNEFHNKSKWAYNSARRHGWLEDYSWFKPKGEKRLIIIFRYVKI